MNETEFDEDDMLFWASVVIYVEQEVKPKLNGFFINDKRLKSFLKQNNITLTYIIHSGFISGYQNRYGDNLKPPTNVYHRMTA